MFFLLLLNLTLLIKILAIRRTSIPNKEQHMHRLSWRNHIRNKNKYSEITKSVISWFSSLTLNNSLKLKKVCEDHKILLRWLFYSKYKVILIAYTIHKQQFSNSLDCGKFNCDLITYEYLTLEGPQGSFWPLMFWQTKNKC